MAVIIQSLCHTYQPQELNPHSTASFLYQGNLSVQMQGHSNWHETVYKLQNLPLFPCSVILTHSTAEIQNKNITFNNNTEEFFSEELFGKKEVTYMYKKELFFFTQNFFKLFKQIIPVLCSKGARLPQATNFCLWATR